MFTMTNIVETMSIDAFNKSYQYFFLGILGILRKGKVRKMKNMFQIQYTKRFPFVKVKGNHLFAIFFSSCLTGIGAFFLETILDYICMQYLVDRGFLCGPFLPIYFFVVFFGLLYVKTPKRTIKNYFISVFFLSISITAVEFIIGNLCEWIYHAPLWTYDGFAPLSYRYVSLTISLLWGFLGAFYLFFVIPFLARLANQMKRKTKCLFTIFFLFFFLIDLLITFILIAKRKGYYQELFSPLPASNRLTFFVIGIPLIVIFLCTALSILKHYFFQKKRKEKGLRE